ncbi:galactose oxidase-like domain-containing protein [Nitrosomonas sp.]|uniref:galactose oxidase-like domain-containing protein n=1 Tax=Nitrosomonas sp. TaxID=42353 RepID=UPI00374CA36E
MSIKFKSFQFAQGIRRFIFILLAGLSLFLSDKGISVAVAAGPEAHIKGEFGTLHTWPLMPIAIMLLPDERVIAYGSGAAGAQGANLNYAVWTPSSGIGSDAFELLPNTTNTDIFCAAQALIPSTGHALLLGGDARVNNIRNYANSDVNIFDPSTDTLVRQTQSMAFKRWYATVVTLPNGEHVVLGGRDSKNFSGTTTTPPTVATYSPTPEVRTADGNWRQLSSATSDTAYGEIGASWSYPKAWLNPQGNIFIVTHNGLMFKLDTSGLGNLSQYSKTTLVSYARMPSVMYAPGRILSLRRDRAAVSININGLGEPVVTSAGTLEKDRQYGSLTVLADGRVWANGGSSTGNDLVGAALDSELWDPKTNVWITTANAATARLYHSASLLLVDGTVITGGGGTPGPLTQLNGEIYYPPYLFKTDGSGEFADRPVIIDAPTAMIGWNQEFSIEASESISRVTLVRAGTVTHNFNQETRFFDIRVPKKGNILNLRTPASSKVAPPGFYLLFAWNAAGVPSLAKIIHIG